MGYVPIGGEDRQERLVIAASAVISRRQCPGPLRAHCRHLRKTIKTERSAGSRPWTNKVRRQATRRESALQPVSGDPPAWQHPLRPGQVLQPQTTFSKQWMALAQHRSTTRSSLLPMGVIRRLPAGESGNPLKKLSKSPRHRAVINSPDGPTCARNEAPGRCSSNFRLVGRNTSPTSAGVIPTRTSSHRCLANPPVARALADLLTRGKETLEEHHLLLGPLGGDVETLVFKLAEDLRVSRLAMANSMAGRPPGRCGCTPAFAPDFGHRAGLPRNDEYGEVADGSKGLQVMAMRASCSKVASQPTRVRVGPALISALVEPVHIAA